jgi:hypothetical protein
MMMLLAAPIRVRLPAMVEPAASAISRSGRSGGSRGRASETSGTLETS